MTAFDDAYAADTGEQAQAPVFWFCTRCHRISCGESPQCVWCRSPELRHFTRREVLLHFRRMAQRDASSRRPRAAG